MESPLSPQQSSEALKAIEQALYNHEQWHEAVQATLICRLPPDERDVAADAHRKCRFGQWYYGGGAALLGRHPGFEEVEIEHRRMHERAARLIAASARGEPIPLQEYERFTSSVKALRLEMLTLKQELEDALYNLDPLTGTASRIGMLTKLREQREFVRRRVQTCSIAMMDLDSFKAVNDLYGHQVGDRVLAESARRAMASLRPYDKVFRYGGEEFLICMPDASLEAAHEIVERLRAAVAEAEHDGNGRGPFRVTASFGLTLLDPDASVETSIERADRALYAAKTRGRDRTVTWSADLA
jgi:diguanylate cyclase (GGDEF)-like protein